MKKFWKTALASAALVLAGSVQATTLDFEGDLGLFQLDDGSSLVGHGDQFAQGDYSFLAFAYSDTQPEYGNLVGAVLNASNALDNCGGLKCPINGQGQFYAALNDSILYLARADGEGFTMKSFDASFIGNGVDPILSVPEKFMIQATRLDGATVTLSYSLAGPTNGNLSFATYVAGSAETMIFTEMYFYGMACASTGACSAFGSNRGQFALDNIQVDAIAAVPEPSSYLLMGLGLAGLSLQSRRRAR